MQEDGSLDVQDLDSDDDAVGEADDVDVALTSFGAGTGLRHRYGKSTIRTGASTSGGTVTSTNPLRGAYPDTSPIHAASGSGQPRLPPLDLSRLGGGIGSVGGGVGGGVAAGRVGPFPRKPQNQAAGVEEVSAVGVGAPVSWPYRDRCLCLGWRTLGVLDAVGGDATPRCSARSLTACALVSKGGEVVHEPLWVLVCLFPMQQEKEGDPVKPGEPGYSHELPLM